MTCGQDDEREINLIEVLWEFLIQWKPAVVCAVIIAILLTGAMYMKNMKAYKSAAAQPKVTGSMSEEDADKEIESVEKGLTELELFKVENAVTNIKTIDGYEKDLSAIEKIDMDGDSINYLTMRYAGRVKGSSFPSLFGEFSDNIKGDKLSRILIDQNPDYDEAARVMDIASCQTLTRYSYLSGVEEISGKDEPEDYTFSVSVVLLKSTDIDQLKEIMTKYIADTDAEIKKTVPHESIELVSTNETHRVDTTAATGFQKKRTDAQTLKEKLATDVSAFTDNQKKLYHLLLVKEGLAESDSEEDAETVADVQNAPAKPSIFSPKYALAGFAGGLFVYGMIILCMYLLTGKVRSLDEVCDCYGIRGIDEVHERRFDTAWRKFIYSKRFYDMHYAKVKKEREDHIASAIRYITECAAHHELKHITIMPAYSDTSEDGLCRSYTDGLKKAWSKDAIPMEISKQWTTEYTFEAPGDDEGLVILMHAGDTAFTTLTRIGGYCHDYSVSVIGTILLEDQGTV